MRWAERIARRVRRADTRAVAVITLVLSLVLALQASWLYLYAAQEALDQADDVIERARNLALSLEAQGEKPEAVLEASLATLRGSRRSARVLDASGAVRAEHGAWPQKHVLRARRPGERGRGLGSLWLLGEDGFLVDSFPLSGGLRLELAMPFERFAKEAAEIGRLVAGIVVLSSLAAYGVARFATRRAFAPLGEGTALLERIDAQHLDARLPTRATDDPVDRHAETLNRVLDGIEDAFARLRGFSSDVAHELRTPLNRIRNVADVALASGDPQELATALERIGGSIDELGRMVEALLLIAEADDRRVPLRRERVDVDAWLRDTVEAWAPAFEERGAKLSLRTAAGTIDADRALLDRVISNLLDNALRHGSAGGAVQLSAERDGAGLSIALDDAGPGIPAAERERVFDRFVRLDRSQRASAGGLGLALARSVARLIGGDLAALPSRLGGARFEWRIQRVGTAPS